MCVLEVCKWILKWIPEMFYLDYLDRVVSKVLYNQVVREEFNQVNGGRGEIRTHGGREPTSVFKTGALNHSATLPWSKFYHRFEIYKTNL